jgi:hypothetical protein
VSVSPKIFFRGSYASCAFRAEIDPVEGRDRCKKKPPWRKIISRAGIAGVRARDD